MPSETSGPDDETLADGFWGVMRQLRTKARDTRSPWDVSPSHTRALRVLARYGVIRLSELAEHLHIAARSTTEVVDALEARGLVERRADPTDRRATLVALTADGEAAMAAVQEARKAEAERLFGALSATDRAHLARILKKLRE